MNTLINKSNLEPLSKTEMQQLVDVTTEAESRLNWSGWASIYVGYLKRSEAKILFSVASAISKQPGFYSNKELMQMTLGYINRGVDYLGQYNQSVYAPYVEVNIQYLHDANGRTTGTTGGRISVKVDEYKAVLLRAGINEYLNNDDKALEDYYKIVRSNFTDVVYTLYSLSPLNDDNIESNYFVARRIMELSLRLKKYDQQLVSFCVGALAGNTIDLADAQNRSAAWKTNWGKLEPLIYKALDEAAADNSETKYIINFKDDVDRSKSTSYDWMITLMNTFDSRNKLITLQEKTRAHDGGNRNVMNLVTYCFSITEGNASPTLTAAADALLQKHFSEMVDVAKTWYSSSDQYDCPKIAWISQRMDKYPVADNDKKWVLKKMKKCGK